MSKFGKLKKLEPKAVKSRFEKDTVDRSLALKHRCKEVDTRIKWRSAEKDFYRAVLLTLEADQALGRGETESALDLLNQALKLSSDVLLLWTMRGKAHLRLGNVQGAISDFTNAIDLNPDCAEAYFRRGAARSLLGPADQEGALQDIDRVSQLVLQHREEQAAYRQAGVTSKSLRSHKQC